MKNITEEDVKNGIKYDYRTFALNMDRAMKYVHDYNYCVKSFHPADIEILNSKLDQIRFKALLEMPSDPNAKRQYIKEGPDICIT